jgi:hypothetical protein
MAPASSLAAAFSYQLRALACRGLALERGQQPMQYLVLGDIWRFDPVKGAQHLSACALAAITGTSAKRLSLTWRSKAVKYFDFLPGADTPGSDQKQECVGVGDSFGELGQPKTRAK